MSSWDFQTEFGDTIAARYKDQYVEVICIENVWEDRKRRREELEKFKYITSLIDLI